MTKELAIKILSTRDRYGCLCGWTSGYTGALDMAIEALKERPKGKWVGAREFCQHLEEVTGEKYQTTGIGNTIYCDQCWQASSRRSKYCPNCGSCNGK